ncbi:DNA mismatch repair protein MutS [Inquilinus limosus]|uniref:DNA mismatch repair protein MutS n=1 Tax=Inquilinus limosus TaxID=171674 RepID=A0A211Z823_9PROT|nr:DNA mismatch repair protein MutS [Inquilinus limosus]OWJ61425.1 DNA mismatch repair protein MutS [Inquilinus limosus]
MMAQYLEAKAAHPDCLLFFRMGDFYEMFFDDAVKAAAALDIALTKRGQHQGEDIPMAGVPAHSHEAYLARLIRQGFRVALCDQTESPEDARKRSGKTLVRREVVRIVTPGTVTEDGLLEPRAANHLVALADVAGTLAIAAVDISSGELVTEPTAPDRLAAALARFDPSEILLPERVLQNPDLFELLGEWKMRLTPQPSARFDSENGRRRLQDLFHVGTLDAFGHFERAEVAAAGALVDYIQLTQKALPRLSPPRRLPRGAVMEIDVATRRNLELTRTLSGDRRGSLLAAIDRTVTGPGARMLASHLAAPLTDPEAVAERLDAVQALVEDGRLRDDLRALLRACPDAERALTRLGLGRGGARDLAAIRDALRQGGALRERLGAPRFLDLPPLLSRAASELGEHDALVDRLARALAEELPLLIRDGGFIAPGYLPELDEVRTLRDESRRLIAALQQRYADETKISTLRIRHNNVIGYHIEVSANQSDKLLQPPHAGTFIHRQTMASAMRFTTVELSTLERSIAEAADKALALELRLFADLVAEVTGRAEAISGAVRALAGFDVAASQAELAVERRYCRPKVTGDTGFRIKGGRHPVVEIALAEAQAGPFVGNDCDLSDERRLWLLTGPNMAGKSTFLRQNALIAVLAQMGGFVPAEEAEIGVVDRLFSRVGAADDLARGHSTFMVEMVETAAILNQAGPRALVILDEIGRGTATFDGLSIAWACVEHLHETTRCRALFATHYHELTALQARLKRLACHTMRVKEWQGDIVFLHEVAPGTADRSYGIHVARLAGLPAAVVGRAQEVLEALEAGKEGRSVARLVDDLPLFSAAAARPVAVAEAPAGPSELETAIAGLDPDAMTPREALERLYALKALLI